MSGRNTNKKHSIGKIVAICAVCAFALWLILAIVISLLERGSAFDFAYALVSAVSDYRVWVIFICFCGGVGVMFAAREMRSSRRVLKINDIEDNHWLTDKEIRTADNAVITSYSKLGDVCDGVPLYARKQGNDLTIVLANPIHTLGIGTTGSGKSVGFVEPIIQILCRTKTKPCIVLSDPKGELYDRNAATLEKQGYDVVVIDISDPYSSARWNPFIGVIEKTRRYKAAASDKPEQIKGKYIFDGETFSTFEQADTSRRLLMQSLDDEIFIDLQDVIYTICPITDKHQPIWEQGARGFILALTVAMWEDLRDGICDEKEFNLFTLYKNISDYTKGDMTAITEYLENRDKFSRAPSAANTVIIATENTRTSYLSQVNNYMLQFADSGIIALTAENDVDLSSFDERPTALFLKIPDEKENRHFLATLFITQLYKTLVEKARRNKKSGETKEPCLKRNVYLILDEFGNMPKFPGIDKIFTVGRSRNIFMLPIIQDYAQLDNKYGKELAGIIKSNSNYKVFIGSTDPNTIKEFSELCGKTKQRHISFSDGNTAERFNVSTSAQSVPLIYPSELEKLNDPPKVMGNAIVLAFGKSPLRSKFEPVFKEKRIYCPVETPPNHVCTPALFNPDAHFYDFTTRSMLFSQATLVAMKQQEEIESALNHVQDEECLDIFAETAAKLQIHKYIAQLSTRIPNYISAFIDKTFYDRDIDEAIEYTEKAMDWAEEHGKRFALADGARLKVLLLTLKDKLVEFTARASPDDDEQYDEEIFEQGVIEDENTNNDEQ